MTTIMGKTILRDSYMSYYNELVELSPMTIDYENLTNIMGFTKTKNLIQKHIFQSTETPFPERNYFHQKKYFVL